MNAYISMPKGTDYEIKSHLADFIYNILNKLDSPLNNLVTWWKESENYTTDKIEEADKVFIHIPEEAFHTDNDIYCYVGKGQSSEIDICVALNKDYAFITWDNEKDSYVLYNLDHVIPEDYNDWKKKYSKCWLKPHEKEEVNYDRKILLLCL